MIIYMDMDEVFSDFVGAAARVHGFTPEEVRESYYRLKSWDMTTVLTELLGRPVSHTEFWRPIHDLGESFWVRLDPLPWFHELTTVLEESRLEWHLLSSPAWGVASYTGKVRWIHNHFGTRFNNFLLTPHKHLLAKPGTVLVDDRPDNITNFTFQVRNGKQYSTGGQGVLFPTSPLASEEERKDPVAVVRALLNRINNPRS